jgi:hypothetical protein
MMATRFAFLLLLSLTTACILPLSAQTTKNQPAKEETRPAEPKGVFSIFKKTESTAPQTQQSDVKARHKAAQKEVRIAKRDRKAAIAKERAARARAEALKAEKRAVGAEKRSDRSGIQAEKTRERLGRN